MWTISAANQITTYQMSAVNQCCQTITHPIDGMQICHSPCGSCEYQSLLHVLFRRREMKGLLKTTRSLGLSGSATGGTYSQICSGTNMHVLMRMGSIDRNNNDNTGSQPINVLVMTWLVVQIPFWYFEVPTCRNNDRAKLKFHHNLSASK